MPLLEALFGLAALGGGYALAVEPRRLLLQRHRIPWPAWRTETRSLRVAVISDIHAAWPHMTERRIRSVVARVLRTRPQLVLLAGDFVSTETLGAIPLPPERTARALAALARHVPTFAVLGNHDWDFDPERVARALEDRGIAVLRNAHRGLRFGGADLVLAGVDDAVSRKDDLDLALLGTLPEEPVLLLSHTPDIHPRAPGQVRLVVAGHTHGGQICLPWVGPLVTMSALPRRQAHGLHRVGDRYLFVSAGVGTTGIPARFARPPEIGMLELVPVEERAHAARAPADAGRREEERALAGDPAFAACPADSLLASPESR